MDLMLLDHAFISYCITCIIGLLGVVVFAYGKITRSHASPIVNDMIVLCAGLTYWMAITAWARARIVIYSDITFLSSWWWEIRVYPVAIALLLIIFYNARKLLRDHWRATQAKILATKLPDGKKDLILVVENFTPLWPVYFGALDKKYDVHFAASYEQAMEKFRLCRYKVIILDVLLGDKKRDGLDLAREIKSLDSTTYVIAATGHHDRYSVARVLRWTNDILYKSFGIKALRSSVAIGMVRTKKWRELEISFNDILA